MSKNATQKLYDEIRNGAHMGIDAIDEMLRKCGDEKFRKELMDTQNEYKYIAHEAAEGLIAEGGVPEELTAGARMGVHWGVKAKMAMDDSRESMSRMVLKGMKMAEKELNRDGEEYKNASGKAHDLADRLLELQQKHKKIYEKYVNE